MRQTIHLWVLLTLVIDFQNVYAQSGDHYDHITWKRITFSVGQVIPLESKDRGALIALTGSKLIVGGGKKEVGGKVLFNDEVFAFELVDDRFVVRDNLHFKLNPKVAFAGQFSNDDGIYCVGGENEYGLSKNVFVLKENGAKTEFIQQALPELPKALKNPTVTALGSKLYVAGGQTTTGENHEFYCLDMAILPGTWKVLEPLTDSLIDIRLFVQSNGWGQTLFAVGQNSINQQGQLFAYDFVTDKWHNYSGFPLIASDMVSVGSTFVLGISQSSLLEQKDSLILYNTITKKEIANADYPSSGLADQGLIKQREGLWLLGFNSDGSLNIWKGSLNTYTFFSLLDYLVLAAYLLFTVFIGLFMAGRQKSTTNYFKGDGKIPGWAVGVSILGTNISAITFLSVPAKTYATNWNYFILTISVLLVIPVINKYFIPFYRNLNITSAYEYLDKRFDYSVRSIASLLYILLEIGRVSIILILPSIALSVVIGIDVKWCILLMGLVTVFYTFKGGIKAVIWTDVFQVFILLGGALVCLLYIPFQLPVAMDEMLETAVLNQKFNIVDLRLNLNDSNLFVVLVGGFVLNFLSFGTDQTTVQRYLTTKDESTTRNSVRIGAWLTVPVAIIFFSIGTLLYLFYYYHPGEVNVSLESQDSIFPWYLVSQLPAGVLGLLIAAIFAAAMSALSSSLNSLSTAFITDFYKVFSKQKSDRSYLVVAKLTTLLIGLSSTGIALFMAERGIVSLWDQFNTIVGLFTGGIGGIFLLGLFTKRANAKGALAGLLIGGVSQYFISRHTSINFLLYAFTGLSICFIAGLLFSYFFPDSSKDISHLTVHKRIKSLENR